MELAEWLSLIGGGGTIGWTGKELLRQSREIKVLKVEKSAAEAEADDYHDKWLTEKTAHAETTASISAMKGELAALTAQVARQATEIGDLKTQLQRMEGAGHA